MVIHIFLDLIMCHPSMRLRPSLGKCGPSGIEILRDLSMGKNLLKEPTKPIDYIFYLMEFNRPSGTYEEMFNDEEETH